MGLRILVVRLELSRSTDPDRCSGSVVELDRQNWRNEYRSTTIVWVTYSRHLGTQVGAIFYYSDS